MQRYQITKRYAHTVATHAMQYYAAELHRYCMQRVRQYDLCRDLVQETFIKFWRYLLRGKKVQSVRSFLYHILNCKIIDMYRKESRSVSLDALIERGFDTNDISIEYLLDAFNWSVTLIIMTKTLNERYRTVIKMRFEEYLPLEEIAQRLNMSKKNLSVLLHRALAKLKPVVSDFIARSMQPQPLARK